MITKEIITKILESTIEDILKGKSIPSLEEDFISANSKLESIEIAQIISRCEELLEENGIEGYDLFEKVFEVEKLTFLSLIDLIYSDLS